jgi:hypothetical protein
MTRLSSVEYSHAPSSSEISDDAASGCESHHEDGHHDKSIAKGGVTTPFPWKLHDMLDDRDKEGKHSIVTWQPHGRAFMVHKPKEFVDQIMHHYFNQTKYASFQRQLNLYGFSRLSHGPDKGAYFHMAFVRGSRNLCRSMIRQKIKGTKVRRSLSPEEEPNFYAPEWNHAKIVAPTTLPGPPKKKQTTSSQQPISPSSTPSVTPPTPVKPVLFKTDPVLSSLISLVRPITMVRPTILPAPSSSAMIKPLRRETRSVSICSQASALNEASSLSESSPSSKCVRGGDLLFFEGQPFRYLEHLEELPPTPQQQPRSREQSYKESLHEIINSIVALEPGRAIDIHNLNVCSV